MELTFKIGNFGQAPVAVVFEPTGMSYELAPRQWFTVEWSGSGQRDIEITHSEDCISVWFWGSIVILDENGNEVGRE